MRASCLCGKIRLEISGNFERATHCHCSMCRKAHGAAFATYGGVKTDQVTIVAGEELISKYDSSPDVTRWFCSVCGANLRWFSKKNPDLFEIPYGILDEEPKLKPTMHIYTASMAPWFEITDHLRQK